MHMTKAKEKKADLRTLHTGYNSLESDVPEFPDFAMIQLSEMHVIVHVRVLLYSPSHVEIAWFLSR